MCTPWHSISWIVGFSFLSLFFLSFFRANIYHAASNSSDNDSFGFNFFFFFSSCAGQREPWIVRIDQLALRKNNWCLYTPSIDLDFMKLLRRETCFVGRQMYPVDRNKLFLPSVIPSYCSMPVTVGSQCSFPLFPYSPLLLYWNLYSWEWGWSS